jgi:hypothetical protein
LPGAPASWQANKAVDVALDDPREAAYVKLAMTPNGPMMTQERVFTLPIWSSPR